MGAETRRLFFALWPGADVRAQLVEHLGGLRLRARWVPRSNLHLTLVFLGSCDARVLARAKAAAERVDFPPFELTLDRLGYFWRPRVLWAGPVNTPPELVALAADLRDALDAEGVMPADATRAFRAHVTVARKAAPPPAGAALPAIRWPVRRFALMESLGGPNGVAYDVLAAWAARG